jgi:O-antigen/teichoic acid export membrane protein
MALSLSTPKLHPLAIYAMGYGVSAALQKGVGFLLFLWLAHSLSVEAYAKFGLLFALQTGLSALAGAGIVESVIGLLKRCATSGGRQEIYGAANGVFVVLAAGCVGLVAIAALPLASSIDATPLELICVTVVGITSAFLTLHAHLRRLEEEHAASLAMNFLPPMAGWVAGYIAFNAHGTVTSFFAGLMVGLVVCLLPFKLKGPGFYDLRGRRTEMLPIFSSIGPFMLTVVVMWLSGYGNTYFIDALFTPTDVARFTFAYTLSSIMQLVATSLNQVWSPRFFRIVHDTAHAEVERKSRRFFALQGFVLGMIGAVVLATVPAAIEFAGLGLSPYRDLNSELFLLFAAYALSIPWYHVQNYYFAYAKGKELMNVTLFTSAVGMLSWIATMWLVGEIGIYCGFVILMSMRMVGTVLWARRAWAVGVLYEGPIIALVLMAAGTMLSVPLARLVH